MLDYPRRTDNFAALVQVLEVEPMYKPNEANLQVTALNTLVTSLRDKTKAVYQAKVALRNARVSRDKFLYDVNGIHDSTLATKKYLKALFGPQSSAYRQVAGIRFKDVKM